MDFITKITYGEDVVVEGNTETVTSQFDAYGYEYSEYLRNGTDIYYTSDNPIDESIWQGLVDDPENPVAAFLTWQSSVQAVSWYTKLTFTAVDDDWLTACDSRFSDAGINATQTENDGTEVTWTSDAPAGTGTWDDYVNDEDCPVIAEVQWVDFD